MMRAVQLTAMCLVMLNLSAGEGGPITTVPTSLAAGDEYRLAFVTSGIRDATSTDIEVYNTFVDGFGDTVIASDWTAIASTSGRNARTNTATDPTPAGDTGVPIFLLNNTQLVDHYDDLWDGSIDGALSIDEFGDDIFSVTVWTGTESTGLQTASFAALGGGAPRYGDSDQTDSDWILDNTASTPSTNRHFYAISGVFTVAAVPEPSTFALFSLGSICLISSRRRRKK